MGSNPRSTTLEARTLTITPPMRLREECVFYILKLLKSIFIVVGKIKEALVGKTFPDRACHTTLTCSHFKVQSETLIMYQIIHPTPSLDMVIIFIFDIVKRSNIPHYRQSIWISSLTSWGKVHTLIYSLNTQHWIAFSFFVNFL